MATMTYGNARYKMPDGMAWQMQKAISALIDEGRSAWYPIAVDLSETDQPIIVDVLIGPGIPISIAFTYDTEDDLDVALREDRTIRKVRRRSSHIEDGGQPLATRRPLFTAAC